MLKISLLPVVALVFLSQAVVAASYRWVDEAGNVNYSQSPPADTRQVQTIKAPPPPPEGEAEKAKNRVDRQNSAFEERKAAKQDAAEELATAQKEAAEDKRYCKKARDNIAMMTSRPPNTLFRMPSGEYKRFTAEEWESTLKKSKKYLADHCK